MSKLPPKPKGPLLLRRVLFTSVIGAGCGTNAMPPQVAPPPQPPPQPPQPHYDVEEADEVRPIDAGTLLQPDPPQVMSEEKTYSTPPRGAPPQVEQEQRAPQGAPPPQVAPPQDARLRKKRVPPQVRRPPQVAPRPIDKEIQAPQVAPRNPNQNH